MVLVKDTTTKAIHNPLNRLIAIPTRKDASFSSNTIGNGDVAENMGKSLDMAEGFIRDMLPKSSYSEAPTIVKDSNKTTDGNVIGYLKSTTVVENNNDSMERANTVLKPNIIFGAHILEEKEEWFYRWADNYDVWNNDFLHTYKRN